MNIESYISSGILDLYAAGALTTAEKAEVEQIAKLHPEIQAELNNINAVLNQYASLHAVTPPAYLKDKVLGAVNKSQQESPIRVKAMQELPAEEDASVIPLVRETHTAASTAFKWLLAASVTLLLISNALSFYFYNNWKNTAQRLQLAEVSQQQFAQSIRQVQQRLTHSEQALALIRDPATQEVTLKGVAKTPDAKATVYWHQETKHVYVSADYLPAPPANQQYQLWALLDGKPIDAGLLDSTQGVLAVQSMKNIARAQAFAITLEPKGGSVSPTLDQMYVMGTI